MLSPTPVGFDPFGSASNLLASSMWRRRASDLASSGAMWLPCGALKAWVIFVASRCWLLVAVEVQLYQVPNDIHPSLCGFFSGAFSFSLRGMLALQRV